MTLGVLDVRAEHLQRNVALFEEVVAGDLGAVEAARHRDLHPDGAGLHGLLDGHLHGPAIRHAPLDLSLDGLGDDVGIRIRVAHLLHLHQERPGETLLKILAQFLDSGALFADEHAGLARVNSERHLLAAVDLQVGDAGLLVLVADVALDVHVLQQELLELRTLREPRTGPRACEAETEAVGVDFLTHGLGGRRSG